MGFDWRRLRMLRHAFEIKEMPLARFAPDAIEVMSDRAEWSGALNRVSETFRFRPHFGWTGAIERAR